MLPPTLTRLRKARSAGRTPHAPAGTPRRLRTALAVLATTAVIGATGSLALAGTTQVFSDVGSGHAFQQEIEQFAAAGISEGYPDGTFRPGAAVSRQAMAAFMARGLSSVAVNYEGAHGPYGSDSGAVPLISRPAVVPWGEGTTQYVLVQGTVDWSADRSRAASCAAIDGTCGFQLSIRDGGQTRVVANTRITADWDGGTALVQAVYAFEGGQEHTPVLFLTPGAGVRPGTIQVHQVQIISQTFPFTLEAGLPA